LRGRREQITARTFGDVGGRGRTGQGLRDLDGVDPVHRVGLQQVVADRPLGEGGDRGALTLAAGRGQLGELGQVGADWRRGQFTDLLAVVGGEGDQVAAVGAPGVGRGAADRLRTETR
jgi:hypothetical protein